MIRGFPNYGSISSDVFALTHATKNGVFLDLIGWERPISNCNPTLAYSHPKQTAATALYFRQINACQIFLPTFLRFQISARQSPLMAWGSHSLLLIDGARESRSENEHLSWRDLETTCQSGLCDSFLLLRKPSVLDYSRISIRLFEVWN